MSELSGFGRLRPTRRARRWLALALLPLKLAALAVLPFVLLIRGSTYLYSSHGWTTWLALVVSLAATLVVVVLYLSLVYALAFGVDKISERTVRAKLVLAVAIVLGYGAFTQLYLSSTNAKSAEVRREYRALHPILRLGVSTVILVDSELLVTDMARAAADYERMGLAENRRSLHYPQEDGYVHAVDLRTVGRGRTRNWLLQAYFRLMGFHTLRHVGTADHLHVSLPLPSEAADGAGRSRAPA